RFVPLGGVHDRRARALTLIIGSGYITIHFNIRWPVKPYKGGVRHDYKDLHLTPPARRRERRLSLFLLGLSLPLAAVSTLLTSERNESKVPTIGEAFESQALTELVIDIPPRLDGLREASLVPQPAVAASELLPL